VPIHVDTHMSSWCWSRLSFSCVFLAHDAFVEQILSLLPWCLSVCLSGTGMRCDRTVHLRMDVSLWLDSPVFWAPLHKNMST